MGTERLSESGTARVLLLPLRQLHGLRRFMSEAVLVPSAKVSLGCAHGFFGELVQWSAKGVHKRTGDVRWRGDAAWRAQL